MPLTSFPEELLERILLHAVIAPSAPHPRASWHSQSSSQTTRGRTAPLLVCHAFHRIAIPFFYHTLVLHSPRQSESLLHSLQARPYLARSVRVLVLPTPSAYDAEVLGMLSKLLVLDVTLPSCESEGIEQLGGAIRRLTTLQDLRVRKGAGTYLSQPAPRAMLGALAEAVDTCNELHTTTLTFPLSSDPSLAPLSAALATAPALRTLRTPMPALWTAAYVDVAENPSLVRVCLGGEESAAFCAPEVSALECGASPGKESECPPPGKQDRILPQRRLTSSASLHPRPCHRALLPTSLFLRAARPHARLSELIRAGTNVAVGWRWRAATVGAY
ncbi:hypothetical protein C8R45DRAFT_302706 [Mycena sanguinolenta]|nr:hypothetical protein C8R45DRAFT_302706 [Mycena sanguinolenta]